MNPADSLGGRSGWRGTRLLVSVLLLAAGAAACGPSKNEVSVSMDQVRADLNTLATARIFFGHQSVGGNILNGVEALSREAGVPLRIVEIPVGSAPPSGPGLFHSNVGANGVPEGKVDDFESSLRAAGSSGYDVALLKFCYVDLDEQSAAGTGERLLTRYQDVVQRINGTLPRTALVHSTMPVMSDPPGFKTRLKRMLGKPTWRDEANIRRADYNARARATFSVSELLDIAALESQGPQGEANHFTVGDRQIQTMAQAYTYDGGHLNEAGRRHVAAAFLNALAAAVARRDAANPAPNRAPGS